jgi:[citrate (pro-3S)-lyase] ligase
MFEEREIRFFEAQALLKKCGLNPVDRADYRVGIFDEDDELLATGALVGNMLQMIAVDPACQGEDLSVRVVTHLVNAAARRGIFCLYLFTKSASVRFFEGMGFQTVAHVPGEVALLEWGSPGIREYCRELAKLRDPDAVRVGALVMNANPFTAGHRFLAETAAKECDKVFLLAVEEDLSEFPFSVRLELIKKGTADLPNVTVLPGGRYVISSLTFPAYFSRDAARSRLQSKIDAEIFAKHIAPALGVTDRFMGEEPFSPSTAIYNEEVKARLEKSGIAVHILTRLALNENEKAVSASEVRRLLAEGKTQEALRLLPETTAEYIRKHEDEVIRWVKKES